MPPTQRPALLAALALTAVAGVAVCGPAPRATTATACPSGAPSAPWRVPNSPYPTPAGGPNTHAPQLFVFSSALLPPSQVLALQTLQGVTARTTPALFQVDAAGDSRAVWLAGLVADYGVVANESLAGDFEGLLRLFKVCVIWFAAHASTRGARKQA
jgi:hypothetical protein